MRSDITLGIIALGIILALSLQGCGRKGALKLPVNHAPAPVSTPSDPQKTDTPSIQPDKQP